ncbi:MAG: hypothetical protein E7158_03605 [Firmicutes bacterium]|nr:hypothetical protein [Bacillota bacterium]
MPRNISERELDKIIKLSEMNLNTSIISSELLKTVSYSDLINSKVEFSKNRKKLLKAKKIYELYKLNGLFNIKDFYRCSAKDFNEKIENLQIIYNTLYSDKSDEVKAEIIFKLYANSNLLRYDYLIFTKYGIGDKRLDSIKNILLNFDKLVEKFKILEAKPNLKKNVLYRNLIQKDLEEHKYAENYLYAKYVIELFIGNDSLSKADFYNKLDIDGKIFNYCVELIKFLDIRLYKKYEQTLLDNSVNKNNKIRTNINEIVYRINNDFTFNILDFYKLVPFKEYEYNFIPYLLSFIINNYGAGSIEYCTIVNYIYQNSITNTVYISEKTYNNKKVLMNGIEITPYIINIIFRYMKINDLPFISNVYDIVLKMYIKKQIDVSEIIQKEQSLEYKSRLLKYKNPYKLV